MKVILNQDVHNLGEEGDVREVAPGYARNYLIPQGLAVLHTKGNLALFDSRRAAIEKRKEEKKKDALSLKEKLDGLSITIETSSGDTGRLFGSVTNATVAEELGRQGFEIERKRIELPEHALKMTGTYTVKVKLYDSNVAEITLEITSPEVRRKEEALKAAAAPAAKAPVKEVEEEGADVQEDGEFSEEAYEAATEAYESEEE